MWHWHYLPAALIEGGTFANSSERLKEKYQPVSRLLDQQGGHLTRYDVENRRLIIHATVPDEATRDRVQWEIDLINPAKDDISADITTPPPAKGK